MNIFTKGLSAPKYGKSVNGRQCLGPCYESNKWTIHPLTLEYITNKNYPFCPTAPWTDPKNKDKIFIQDRCHKPSKDVDDIAIQMNVIIPEITFTHEHFLKIYYKIYSFENATSWISKYEHKPILTKLRILECAWKAYGNTLSILTNDLVIIYIDIIKKYWMKYIYKSIGKYVNVETKKIYFNKPTNANNKYKVEKINFIIKKLVTNNNIYKILYKYITDNIDKWDDIEYYNKTILNYIIEYFKIKIKEIIDK